jgi:hypothetical protein
MWLGECEPPAWHSLIPALRPVPDCGESISLADCSVSSRPTGCSGLPTATIDAFARGVHLVTSLDRIQLRPSLHSLLNLRFR